MFFPSTLWTTLGLLTLSVRASREVHLSRSVLASLTTIYDPTCTANVTVINTRTIVSKTTKNIEVTVPHTVNITISSTKCVTTTTTTTVHCTVSVTTYTTNILPVTVTTHTTKTLPVTTQTTQTLPVTTQTTQTLPVTTYTTQTLPVTTRTTRTETVSATVTTYTTTTVLSTKVDPCPTLCSISAATVNVFFWPTDRPHTYPSTYVDKRYDYTFTSPSVYIYIPTAKGTNSLGLPVGPSTSSWMLPQRLEEVSTIVDGTLTRQLSLSDLGTDCAQTAEPSAIATMVDSRCDPILAAPKQVSSWAYPCNACGRFGLFDPPYAVPTLTGGLLPTTTTVVPVPTVTIPAPTSVPPVGVLLIVYYSNGTPMATATLPTTGITGTVTSSVFVSAPASTTSPVPVTTPVQTLPPGTTTRSTATSITSTPVTASGTNFKNNLGWLILTSLIAVVMF